MAQAAVVAACALLAGCEEGSLDIDGKVLRADGKPAKNARVTITVSEESPYWLEDEVYTTGRDGSFKVRRKDCSCDFDVQFAVEHPEHGRAMYWITHRGLKRDPAIVIVLDGKAVASPPEIRPGKH